VGTRLAAAAIDVAIATATFFVTGLVAIFVGAAVHAPFVWVWPVQLLVVVAGLIANVVVLQGRRGASVGKAAMTIAVVDDIDGYPIGVGRSLVRLPIHAIVDALALIGPLLMVVDSAERRTVADRVCRSVVVSTR
jgi:uncharacterized RDD family membrane protein YckC